MGALTARAGANGSGGGSGMAPPAAVPDADNEDRNLSCSGEPTSEYSTSPLHAWPSHTQNECALGLAECHV